MKIIKTTLRGLVYSLLAWVVMWWILLLLSIMWFGLMWFVGGPLPSSPDRVPNATAVISGVFTLCGMVWAVGNYCHDKEDVCKPQ